MWLSGLFPSGLFSGCPGFSSHKSCFEGVFGLLFCDMATHKPYKKNINHL